MWVRARMPVYSLNWTRGLVQYVVYKGDKSAARPPGGCLVETRSLKASSLPLFLLQSHAPNRSPEQAPGCCSSGRTRLLTLLRLLLLKQVVELFHPPYSQVLIYLTSYNFLYLKLTSAVIILKICSQEDICSVEEFLEEHFSTLFRDRIAMFEHYCIKYLMGIVFANRPGDLGSIPGLVIPKTRKMVLYTSLLNTQLYKVHIKVREELSRERSCALFYISVL